MPVIPLPDVRMALADLRRCRLEELLDEVRVDELRAHRTLAELEATVEVKRMVVGEHVMLRITDEFEPPQYVKPAGAIDVGGSAGKKREVAD